MSEEHTTLEELQRQSEELQLQQQALANRIKEAQKGALRDFVAAVFDDADARGFLRADLLRAFGCKEHRELRQRRRAVNTDSGYRRERTIYFLPELPEQEWIGRGRPPQWVKDTMLARGMNPDSRDDRMHFRSTLESRVV